MTCCISPLELRSSSAVCRVAAICTICVSSCNDTILEQNWSFDAGQLDAVTSFCSLCASFHRSHAYVQVICETNITMHGFIIFEKRWVGNSYSLQTRIAQAWIRKDESTLLWVTLVQASYALVRVGLDWAGLLYGMWWTWFKKFKLSWSWAIFMTGLVDPYKSWPL